MSLGCFKISSLFNLCFCNCITKKSGSPLGNKVGSTTNLNEIENNGIEALASTNVFKGTSHRKISLQSNNDNQSNSTETSTQERRESEVIIQQPINKIKIVNVTYQKHYIKQNTINRKRISNAIDGHVNSLRRSSTESNSSNQSPEGIKIFSIYFKANFEH